MKTAAIFDPYWDTLGGGEKYIATAILAYIQAGFHPIILWHDQLLLNQIYNRFGINLNHATVDPQLYQIFKSGSFFSKLKSSSQFNSFLWVSDGSIPILASKNNLLHFQVPFNQKVSIPNQLKTKNFRDIICNSNFTKSIIDKNYKCNSQVLYPPVTLISPHEKKNMILSVGRFDNILHSKRQDVLIEAFKQLNLPKWKLVLAGGSLSSDRTEYLKKYIGDSNIEIVVNPQFLDIKELYACSRIYWHAAGYGSNLKKSPEKAEHFGISTVEAMSAGAIPVVYAGGGQLEIINDQTNGYLWHNPDELVEITQKIINHKLNTKTIVQKAVTTAGKFSQERFIHEFNKFIS